MKKSARSRPPGRMEPIDSILGQLFCKGKFACSVQVAELCNCWSELVGEDAALHCTPDKISGGKLYIKVDSSVWHQQLDMFKEELLKKMSRRVQHLQVEKIVCKTISA